MADTKASEGAGTSGVAGRYASALFDLAREEGQIDSVGKELDNFQALLDESADLRRLIKSPVISAEEQDRAIDSVLKKAGIGGLAGNLIRLTASNRRLFVLPQMIRAYRSLVAEHKGIVSAEVRLAETPSTEQLDTIKTAIREMAGSDVDLDVKIDPALIGGLVVKIGSRMVDASLKTKLNSIRIAMKEAR